MSRYASHLAHHPEPAVAVDVAADHVEHDLGGETATLVVAMASDAHRAEAESLLDAVRARFPAAAVCGAIAPGGVIGVGEETDREPAVSLLAAVLPDGAAAVVEVDGADGLPDDAQLLVAFADPYTVDVDGLAAAADATGIALAGGLTGGRGAGDARLLATDGVRTSGAVALRLDLPGAGVHVSQGARPIAHDVVVTAAEGNVVLELAGRPAVERLHGILASLGPDDLRLARTGLMAGIVIDENRPDWDVGDYLIRGLLGVVPESGGLAIAAEPRVGQTLRFHVRDAAGADADLRRVLGGAEGAGAALLFSCTGRGPHMFDGPDHDAGVVAELLDVPVVGGFCQGELGPVAGANHVHAFTATTVVLPR